MAPTRILHYISSSSRRFFLEGSTSISQERNEVSNHKVLQPIIMEENFLKNSKHM